MPGEWVCVGVCDATRAAANVYVASSSCKEGCLLSSFDAWWWLLYSLSLACVLSCTQTGRVVPSRYMNATASSRAATSKPSTAQQKPFSSTLGPAKNGPAASTRAKHPASSTTKPRAVVPSKSSSLSVSRAPRPPSRPATNESPGTGSASTFELEAASQLYPWLFMRHTLAEASDAATRKAQVCDTACPKVDEL